MKKLHKNNSTKAQRDAQKEAVKTTVSDYLRDQPEGFTISTRELGILISPDDPYVAVQCLTAIAKEMARAGLCRRGEPFRNKWGKTIRPNIWGVTAPNDYGEQSKPAPVEDALPEDALPKVPAKKNTAQILEEWKAKNAARRQQG
jgi:hypothetical protein